MGRIRQNNEDNFYVQGRYRHEDETKNDIVFAGEFPARGKELVAVYDGMGGEACGEVASLLAASHTGPLSGKEKDVNQALNDLCVRLNHVVCQYAVEHQVSCMGSTAVLALWGKEKFHVCNLGDSRIYILHDKSLTQLSVDHVAQVEGKRKAPLTQYLGLPETEYLLEPYCTSVPYQEGDVFLLCSDGITDMLTDSEILSILDSEGTIAERAMKLVSKALQNGGIDNTTVILCTARKRHWISSGKEYRKQGKSDGLR